jgi:NitT/TauT family transport system substrate-binding protein
MTRVDDQKPILNARIILRDLINNFGPRVIQEAKDDPAPAQIVVAGEVGAGFDRPFVRQTVGFQMKLFMLLAALVLSSGAASAQSNVTIAVGGSSCLCYLPPMLANQLGEFKNAGVNVDIAEFKGGSDSLKALISGSADVAIGYYDHSIELAARGQHLKSFVVYDRFPGVALVVSPKHADEIKSIKDLANKKVGVTAPGSTSDFMLRYLLSKNGVDANSVGIVGIGLDASAIAAMEHGDIDAAIMLDPAITLLMSRNKAATILLDTRTQKDTLSVFAGEYPGGVLYSRSDWIANHQKEVQAITKAILVTLNWIHTHSAEQIADKMPPEFVGKDKALYVAALEHMLPMYSENGRMDAKGAEAVLAVLSHSSRDVANAHIDLPETYTNQFAVSAGALGPK